MELYIYDSSGDDEKGVYDCQYDRLPTFDHVKVVRKKKTNSRVLPAALKPMLFRKREQSSASIEVRPPWRHSNWGRTHRCPSRSIAMQDAAWLADDTPPSFGGWGTELTAKKLINTHIPHPKMRLPSKHPTRRSIHSRCYPIGSASRGVRILPPVTEFLKR